MIDAAIAMTKRLRLRFTSLNLLRKFVNAQTLSEIACRGVKI